MHVLFWEVLLSYPMEVPIKNHKRRRNIDELVGIDGMAENPIVGGLFLVGGIELDRWLFVGRVGLGKINKLDLKQRKQKAQVI